MEKRVQVPTVIGISATQAEVVLVAAGLTYSHTLSEKTQPEMVTSQSPAVGAWHGIVGHRTVRPDGPSAHALRCPRPPGW